MKENTSLRWWQTTDNLPVCVRATIPSTKQVNFCREVEPEATLVRQQQKEAAVTPAQLCCRRHKPALSSLKTDMTKSPLVISCLSTRLITVSKGKPPITPKSQKPFSPGSAIGEGRILLNYALVKEVIGHMLGFLSAPCPRPPSGLNAFKQDWGCL